MMKRAVWWLLGGLVLGVLGVLSVALPGEARLAPVARAAAPLATPICGPGTWSPRTPPPAGSYDPMWAVAQGGKIYIYDASTYQYDPVLDTWDPFPSPPSSTELASAVSDGTYLYILNGQDGSSYSTNLYRYDPVTETYTTLAPAPLATGEQAAVYLNGKIYRIAGLVDGSTATTSVDAYTISTNSWAPAGTVADYPLAVAGLNAVAAGGYIYAGGGGLPDYQNMTNKTYRYNPTTNTWDDAAVPDLPAERYRGVGDILNGRWLLAGGAGRDYQIDKDVIALDLSNPAGGWTGLTWQPYWRWLGIGAVANGAFYTFGGRSLLWSWNETMQYQESTCGASPTPTAVPPTATPTGTPPACGAGTWNQAPRLPAPVALASAATLNGDLYVFGGFGNGLPMANAYRYTPATGTWTQLHSLPVALAEAGVVSDGTYLYILAGIDWFGDPQANLYRYDPATDSYLTLAPDRIATQGPGVVYLNGQIYRISGSDQPPSGTTTVDVYTISTNTWAPAGTVADYPESTDGFPAVVAGGYIYAGGSKTYRYDPASNTWDDAAVTDLPEYHYGSATGVLNGRWIIAATESGNTTVIALDLNQPTGAWATLPALPLVRSGPVGATIGNSFYALGGFNSDDPYNSLNGSEEVQRYDERNCSSPTPTARPASPTATRPPSATATRTSLPLSRTPAPSPTGQAPGSPTPSARPPALTSTPAAGTATPCAIRFSDVQPGDYFYEPVRYLACRGVLSGYAGGTFRPYAGTTRAQQVKIVVLGFARPVQTPTGGAYTFADVPPSQPFYAYVETAAALGVIGGYPCGGPGEPCDGQGRRYFRPNAAVTRGQLAKMTVLTAGWALLTPAQPTFTDVPAGSAFYPFVETAVCRGIVSGYADGTFRPGAGATRGQIAKIVYLAVTAPPGACLP